MPVKQTRLIVIALALLPDQTETLIGEIQRNVK
jgi:hypothetical protein